MIIVDSWLVYKGGYGMESHLTQKEFYEEISTIFIDNNSVVNAENDIKATEGIHVQTENEDTNVMPIPQKRR